LSLEIYNFEGCNIVFGKSRYVGHGLWIMRYLFSCTSMIGSLGVCFMYGCQEHIDAL
jgi:hypothetical protein